jgi:hypothetical protein
MRSGVPDPDLDATPPVVARYLRRALGDDHRAVRVARLRQAGVLRTSPRSARWLSFTAEQAVTPPAVAFTWNARVRVAPLVHVNVRDAYADGEGAGQVRLFSLLPLGGARGGEAMNSGSLHRYLAEAVWYPTALWPSRGLRWAPLDASKALATLTDRGTTVSLAFSFDEAGDVAGIHTPGRWGKFEDGYRQAPWEGHFRGYGERAGLRVPAEGEVGWYDAGRWECVFRGRLTDARYER